MIAYLSTCLLAYLPICLLAYLITYLLPYFNFWLNYSLSYLLPCLHACLIIWSLDYLLTCLHAYWLASSHVCLHATYILTCLLVHLYFDFLLYYFLLNCKLIYSLPLNGFLDFLIASFLTCLLAWLFTTLITCLLPDFLTSSHTKLLSGLLAYLVAAYLFTFLLT